MFETMASFMLVEHANGAMFDPPLGPAIYPRTVAPNRKPYRTKDGYIAALIYNDKHWTAFVDAVQPAWDERACTPRSSSGPSRSTTVYGLIARDDRWSGPPRNGWTLFRELEIPAAPLQTPAELFDDPHLNAVGFFETVRHRARPGALSRCADLVFAHAGPGRRARPELGADTAEVLEELGIGARGAGGSRSRLGVAGFGGLSGAGPAAYFGRRRAVSAADAVGPHLNWRLHRAGRGTRSIGGNKAADQETGRRAGEVSMEPAGAYPVPVHSARKPRWVAPPPASRSTTRRASDDGDRPERRPGIRALDGLRALAVGLVLADHGGIPGMAGGFLGVDVFFVLSGFLITSLLLDELGRTGRIDLANFWIRRARRLLPALVLMVLTVAVGRQLFSPEADRQPARRRRRRILLGGELDVRRGQDRLLRPGISAVAAAARLVARRGRAVLHRLAAGTGRGRGGTRGPRTSAEEAGHGRRSPV